MSNHYSIGPLLRTTIATLLAVAWTSHVAFAQYTYIQDTTDAVGNWNDPAQWTGGPAGTYPNAIDATVLFNSPIKSPSTGTYTLTLPSTDVTVGQFKIDNTGFTNTSRDVFATAGGQLIFQSSSGPAKYIETANTGTAPANTQNQIQANILVNSDLEITQDNYPNLNTGTTFTGLINGDASKTITKKGAAGIQFNYAFSLNAGEGFLGQYVIQAGAIRLINSSSAIAKSSGVTVQSGGQLQLADNAATAVPAYNLASGAVLNLNGPGKATGTATPEGALRFGITGGRTTTFPNAVVLQTDSVISVAALNTVGQLDGAVSGSGWLTKQGDGKLILTNAADAYGGDTHVLSGPTTGISTLSLSNPVLPDGKDVYLSATRTALDLNFAGTDTIRSFYIDNVAQPIGLWGATGSGAAHESALITGAGLLNVTTLPVVGVPGDYNNNGVVDAADYVLWRQNLGTNTQLQNEVSGTTPGQVTQEDYDAWRARFGNTMGSGSSLGAAAVPEPSVLLLLILVTPFIVGRTFGRIRS